jgi:transposase
MKRFIEGQSRTQATFLPECIDDYIVEDNPVRVIEAFVDELELQDLGFQGMMPEETGRPSYHPSTLLKIYIYGYINRIQSSRRLEREAQRNLELMWLTGRLAPDFKTIADFRKDNGAPIRGVCREFILLCRRLELFSQAIVAIDGSKFKAVNNRDRNFTSAKMKRRLEQIEESINRYLAQLDTADRQESQGAQIKSVRLKDKVAKLKEEMRRLKKLEVRMNAAPDKQVSLTDPDARSMATSGKGTGVVGYNVQTAVETQHHLIVAHEVTNVGHDRGQLSAMAEKAREAVDSDELTVVADRGYFDSEEIRTCGQSGITPYVPRPLPSTATADGRFGKPDFIYEQEKDEYRCPAGEQLIKRFTTLENGMTLHVYWSSACPKCPIKAQCTASPYRRVRRWEHEAIIEAMQERLDRNPDTMKLRRQTVEHPFGTLKAWMGATHFLTRTLPRVSTEMSLHVLAYNMKRVMKILGTGALMEAIRI